jgi:ankyrin repeat protein
LDGLDQSIFCNGVGPQFLLWAAKFGNNRVIELLLEAGVDPDATDSEGNTGLHHAALNCRILTVRSLLNSGASVSVRNRSGNTPLHYAAAWGDEMLLLLFLRKGADIEWTANDGKTPLQIAMLFENEAAINALKNANRSDRREE